jgi:hypothetical protein
MNKNVEKLINMKNALGRNLKLKMVKKNLILNKFYWHHQTIVKKVFYLKKKTI